MWFAVMFAVRTVIKRPPYSRLAVISYKAVRVVKRSVSACRWGQVEAVPRQDSEDRSEMPHCS